MAMMQKKSDCEHALVNLLNSAVGSPSDLIVRRFFSDGGLFNLISKPRFILDQISAKKEDELLALQYYKMGLTRKLSFCISHYLGNQETSSFRCTSIIPDDFKEFRVSAKCK